VFFFKATFNVKKNKADELTFVIRHNEYKHEKKMINCLCLFEFCKCLLLIGITDVNVNN